jgi:hypothetical protein
MSGALRLLAKRGMMLFDLAIIIWAIASVALPLYLAWAWREMRKK